MSMQNHLFEASTTIHVPQESEKSLPCCKSGSVSKLGDTRVFLKKEKRVSTNVLFSSLRRDFTVLLKVTAPGTKSQKYQAKYQVAKHLLESGGKKKQEERTLF